MSKNFKQTIGSKIIFGFAFPLFLRLSKSFDYWITVIHNKTFNPEINGENWLVDQCPKDGLYIDIGFNEGGWSKYVLQNKPLAKIFAFDPCLDVIEKFKSEKDKSKNLELIQMAVSNAEGTLDFYDYGELNGCNSLSKRDMDFDKSIKPKIYTVNVVTLDDWSRQRGIEHIDLLKVDAEGYDLNVLEGAINLLDGEKIDLIVFEYSTGWLSNSRFLREAVDFFSDKPYKLLKLFPSFLIPYSYHISHEGKMFSMFVAISERKILSSPTMSLIRPVEL